MATRIIEGAGAPDTSFDEISVETPAGQLTAVVNGLSRAARCIELLDWIERARRLATEVRTAAASDCALREALSASNVLVHDAAFGSEESGGLQEILVQTGELVFNAQAVPDELRKQMQSTDGAGA